MLCGIRFRVTIAFFAICGLDVLDSLSSIPDEMKQNIIDWVYSHQVVPKENGRPCGGFQGSSTLNTKNTDPNCGLNDYKWGHLAMTYTGLAILITLGDDLSRVNRKVIIEGTHSFKGAFNNENLFIFLICFCRCSRCTEIRWKF